MRMDWKSPNKIALAAANSQTILRIALLLVLVLVSNSQSTQECERLKKPLEYTQEEAPRDFSQLLNVVVAKVNQDLNYVTDVEVEWEGADLHGRVGEHLVRSKVTRLAITDEDIKTSDQVDESGRPVMTQCFHVPFTIFDTNECTLPRGHVMRHQCHASSICVNTIGSYECVCPQLGQLASELQSTTVDESFWEQLQSQERNTWEISFNTTTRTSCPSLPSTHGCCPDFVHIQDTGLGSCRASFRCPHDPCGSRDSNDCVNSATCIRQDSPLSKPNFICQCATGLMGNGHACTNKDPKPQPKVMYDGVTPTEETIRNNMYCGCNKPVVDACSGFPPCPGKHQVCKVIANNTPQCVCKPGFVMHDEYGCVDEKPPVLRLMNDVRGDNVLRLKQGDVYKEHAVDIQDENREEYLRSLKIAYSRPLPQGCLTEVGEFHVNYTIATPWTTPPYIRITRRVIIEDIDECNADIRKLAITCPELIPQCDTKHGAKCINTKGSYTCECPKHTSGDGFRRDATIDSTKHTPPGYQGGTSCVDTSIPVIQLKGLNPKVFRVCACGGITGISGKTSTSGDADLRANQQKYYYDDIRSLIKSTAGAELCATHDQPNPSPNDCIRAYDDTYKGRVDLTKSVVVGEPEQKSALRWSVPYNVKDAAGNEADTVWRDVVVEEVDLALIESKVRQDVSKEIESKIRHAVDLAVREDRKKRGQPEAKPCPVCPPCECSQGYNTKSDSSEQTCKAYCEKDQHDLHAIVEQSYLYRISLWLQRYTPNSLLTTIWTVFIGLFLLTLWTCVRALSKSLNLWLKRRWEEQLKHENASFGPFYDPKRPLANGYSNGDTFMSPINAQQPQSQQQSAQRLQQPPRHTPNPTSNGSFFASPITDGVGSNSVNRYRDERDQNNVFVSSTTITPSKRGDGIRKWTPNSNYI